MKIRHTLLALPGVLAAGLLLPGCHADRTSDDTHMYGYSPTGGPVYTDDHYTANNTRYNRYDTRDELDRGYTPTGSPVFHDDGSNYYSGDNHPNRYHDNRVYRDERVYRDDRRYRDDYYR